MASIYFPYSYHWGGKFVNALGEEFMSKYDPEYGNKRTTKREYACLQEEGQSILISLRLLPISSSC